MNLLTSSTPAAPPPPTGKRRGRKRKCETPITLPQIGETDNLRITNETPEYCQTPVLFGDVMIFSKKEENVKTTTTTTSTILPLLPLLNNNNNNNNSPASTHHPEPSSFRYPPPPQPPVIRRRHNDRNNNNLTCHVEQDGLPQRPPLRSLLPSTQSGLGSNINYKTNVTLIEKGVPPKTDAACWWCCHTFDWHPLSLPVHYDEKRNKFKVSGNFCSWNCMKAFNGRTNSVNKFRQHQYIHDLFRKIVLDKNGKPFPYKHIPLAPSRWTLKLFGGTKTIEEFRKDCVLLDGMGAVRLERTTILCVQPIEPARNFTQ